MSEDRLSSAIKPKKQFKSQSVNDLFRQQATKSVNSSSNGSIKNPRDAGALRTNKSSGMAKLKLVSKKRSSTTFILKNKNSSTSSSNSSPSPTPADPTPISTSASTTSIPETPHDDIKASLDPSKEESQNNQADSQQQSHSSFSDTKPPAIENNTNDSYPKVRHISDSMVSPEISWSSPNSKISSFRRSVGTPLHSLNQSPLSRPFDPSSSHLQSSPNNFFNEGVFTMNNSPFSTSSTSRQLSKSNNQNLVPEEQFWNSPSIWNNEETRQLSTKSDSGIPWSPFDIDALNLDDSFKQTPEQSFIDHQQQQHQQQNQSHLEGNSSRSTSRFFPSPIVDQNKGFESLFDFNGLFKANYEDNAIPEIPLIPESKSHIDLGSSSRSLNIYEDHPRALVTSSGKLDKELFPGNFEVDEKQIPVSFHVSNKSKSLTKKRYPYRNSFHELPHYPEGFSSTFYKRGVNNFMFIRELQPKMITSKHGDFVEMRIKFPGKRNEGGNNDNGYKIPDEFDRTRVKNGVVNIDVRELEGKFSGLKLNKNNGTFAKRQTGNRGHFPKSFHGNYGYNKREKYRE